jgi:hypothetical protein
MLITCKTPKNFYNGPGDFIILSRRRCILMLGDIVGAIGAACIAIFLVIMVAGMAGVI